MPVRISRTQQQIPCASSLPGCECMLFGGGFGWDILCIHSRCIYIYRRMKRSTPIQLECLCASFRQSTRALTQLYESALRPLGLRATQFTILQALSLTGEVKQSRLGEILGIDSTTLTRTLEIMTRKDWIEERRGDDRRERWLQLSATGRKQFHRALPVWEKVQLRLRHQLGEAAWKNLLEMTHAVTALVSAKN